MKHPEVTTILSDVGGVLIRNFDAARVVQQATELESEVFDRIWPGLVYRFGTGAISEQDVLEVLSLNGGNISPGEDLFRKPFENALHIHGKVFATMKKLGANGMHLGILSDTIEPHTAILEKVGLYNPTVFNAGVYLSHRIKMRKPEPTAYEYVLSQLPVTGPSEILFIDDKAINLAPAQKIGMQTLLASGSEETITASLIDYLEA